MAGVDYLAMVSDPEELLSIARSIDGAKVAQLLGQYQQMVQELAAVGQFGHDVDGAAASQLFGKFVDEAHHESAVLSYAALNISDTCNRMKAKLSNFYEQYVEKVQPAAQTLQQVYDAQLGHGSASSPAELRTASTALAKALSHLYTDLAGNPTINVAPTFPEAAIPDIGADGRRAVAGQSPANSRNGSVPADPERPAAPTGQQDGSLREQDDAVLTGSQGALSAAPVGAAAQAAGSAQPGGGGGATAQTGGAGQASGGGRHAAASNAGKSGAGKGDAAQSSPASAIGGALGALGQAGSAAGSGLAGAAGTLAGAAGTGAGIAADAVGLGTSLGGAAAQPAAASGPFGDNVADVGVDGKIGDSVPAATKPASDFSAGGGGGAHPLAEPGSRIGAPPELRPVPVATSLPAEPIATGSNTAGSSGMMGMPMMGGAGMNGANGEHRVANYLISKEQGERQFTAGLPLASEEILGILDERERLAMQIASIEEPGGEVR